MVISWNRLELVLSTFKPPLTQLSLVHLVILFVPRASASDKSREANLSRMNILPKLTELGL